MRIRLVSLVALLLLAPLAGVLPSQAAPPDRPPVVWAGDDQTVKSSPLSCLEDLDDCNRVIINTRYDASCRINDRTYDPDPGECGSLRFLFRSTPFPCNPDPLKGGGVPCIPIGDGSKYIDYTSEGLKFDQAPTVIESQDCKRQAGVDAGDAPDIMLFPTDELGEDIAGVFAFIVPPMPPGQYAVCHYSIDILVYDGVKHPAQPNPPAAGVTDYTMDVDTVVITVERGPSPPVDLDAIILTYVCTGPMLDPQARCVRRDGADIVLDHGKYLRFQYGNSIIPAQADHEDAVADDKEVRGVQVLLNGEGIPNPHNILLPLTRKVVLQPYSQSPPQPELSVWYGELPIDTPALTAGTWQLNARLFDSDGGIVLFEGNDEEGEPITLGELEITSEPVTPDGLPVAPCEPPNGNGACIALSLAPITSEAPASCFDGYTTIPRPFAIGKGETIRPEVFWPKADDPDGEIQPPIFDQGLLGWKLTYETCVLADDNTAITGDEVELRYPYYMSVDTLFRSAQEVAIRAYDRIGGAVETIVIPITKDTDKPTYAMDPPLLRDPAITYKGIDFDMVVFVKDRIDTRVSLHINAVNQTEAGKAVPYDAIMVANQPPSRVGTAVTLPRLGTSAIVLFDVFGQQDMTTVCDYLIDWDGDQVLDAYYHWADHSLGSLVAEGGDADQPPRYLVDLDGNGAADIGELMIQGVDGDERVQDANKCIDPFEDHPHLQWFLSANATQVFAFNVTRHVLGATAYAFTIEDVVYNQRAGATYAFTYTTAAGKVLSPTSSLRGTLETFHAIVDARVVSIGLDEDTPKMILAGDAVGIDTAVTQEPRLVPAPAPGTEPVVPLQVYLTDVGSSDCRNPADDANCLRVCPVTPGATGCDGVATKAGEILEHEFTRPLPLFGPDQLDAHGLVPGGITPGLAARAANPYRAGQHTVVAYVDVGAAATDDDLANNAKAVTFEVYLGQVVVGAYPKEGNPSGRVFFVKANSNTGLPAPADGAVEVDQDHNIVATHPMAYNQTYDVPRYDFWYEDADGVRQYAYFEPQTRYSPSLGKACTPDMSTADDATCRYITIITPGSDEEDNGTKSTPGAAVPVLLLLLAAVALVRRRA